jgi:hypothetical protein
MKILFTRAWEMFARHIGTVNHKAALENHDEHNSLGPYSILCSLDKKTNSKVSW